MSGSSPLDTFTDLLNLVKPAVGQSRDTWGTKTNSNWDRVDNAYASLTEAIITAEAGIVTLIAGANANANGRVSKAGDTISGNLVLQKSNPVLVLQKGSSTGEVNRIQGNTGSAGRWLLDLGGAENETGGNAGSPFRVGRYADNGTYAGDALTINRATGQITAFGPVALAVEGTVASHVVSKGYVDAADAAVNANANARVARTGDTMTGDLSLTRAASPGTGALFLGNSGSRFLFWDGSNFTLNGPLVLNGALNMGGNVVAAGGFSTGGVTTTGFVRVGGDVRTNLLYFQDGDPGTQIVWGGGGHINFNTSGNIRMQLRPDSTQFWGTVFSTSDFQQGSDVNLKDNIKTARGIDLIDQLHGVEFTWKRNGKASSGVIAQELQDVLPHLVHADAEGNLSVAYMPLIGHLIEAIKDLKARIEEIEASAEFI